MNPNNPAALHLQEILDARTRFVPLKQIAKEIGATERSVSLVLKSLGMPTKVPNACEKNQGLVLQYAATGVPSREIARRIGTNDRWVRKFLDDHGVPRSHSFSNPGKMNPAWKGGRIVDTDGYILLWIPTHPDCNCHGYVREHRLVMEAMIGRRLSRQEVVHHKNKKPADNRPENLQLFSENAEHLKHELKGQCPKWTPEGYERIQKGVTRWRESRREHNRQKLKHGASPSK